MPPKPKDNLVMTRTLFSLALLASLAQFACDGPPPPPPQEEEVPEAYKIMMAQREAKRAGKESPSAPSTPPPAEEEEEDDPDFAGQAEAALVHGKLEDTIRLCEQAEAQGSPCITTHAMAHYLSGNTKQACTLFERAKSVDALSPELLAIHQVSCIKKSASSRKQATEEAAKSPVSHAAPERRILDESKDVFAPEFRQKGTKPLTID